MTTKGAAWSTLRRREAKLTTVGKTARIQGNVERSMRRGTVMVRAGDGMPVLMRGRMHLARKPYSNCHTDKQKNHHLSCFVGDKWHHSILLSIRTGTSPAFLKPNTA